MSEHRHSMLPEAARTCPERRFPGGRNEAFRVYFTPEVHAALWKHAGEDTSVEICGVLVGTWHRDEVGPFVKIVESIRGEGADDPVRRGDLHPPDLGEDQRRDGHEVRRPEDRRLVSHPPGFRDLPLGPRPVHPGAFLLGARAGRPRDRPDAPDRGGLRLAGREADAGGPFLGRRPDPDGVGRRRRPAAAGGCRRCAPARGGTAPAAAADAGAPDALLPPPGRLIMYGGVFLVGYLLAMIVSAWERQRFVEAVLASNGVVGAAPPGPRRRARPAPARPGGRRGAARGGAGEVQARRTGRSATSGAARRRVAAGRDHQGAVRQHAGRGRM